MRITITGRVGERCVSVKELIEKVLSGCDLPTSVPVVVRIKRKK